MCCCFFIHPDLCLFSIHTYWYSLYKHTIYKASVLIQIVTCKYRQRISGCFSYFLPSSCLCLFSIHCTITAWWISTNPDRSCIHWRLNLITEISMHPVLSVCPDLRIDRMIIGFINFLWVRVIRNQGLYSLKWDHIGILIINLKQSDNRLRFMMGIPIPIRQCLLRQ